MTRCHCGATIMRFPLEPDFAELVGRAFIWVHVHSGAQRCYPEHPEDHALVATPTHHERR